jgi:hypothetical protein
VNMEIEKEPLENKEMSQSTMWTEKIHVMKWKGINK